MAAFRDVSATSVFCVILLFFWLYLLLTSYHLYESRARLLTWREHLRGFCLP
jgi:hypothetical protein